MISMNLDGKGNPRLLESKEAIICTVYSCGKTIIISVIKKIIQNYTKGNKSLCVGNTKLEKISEDSQSLVSEYSDALSKKIKKFNPSKHK